MNKNMLFLFYNYLSQSQYKGRILHSMFCTTSCNSILKQLKNQQKDISIKSQHLKNNTPANYVSKSNLQSIMHEAVRRTQQTHAQLILFSIIQNTLQFCGSPTCCIMIRCFTNIFCTYNSVRFSPLYKVHWKQKTNYNTEQGLSPRYLLIKSPIMVSNTPALLLL